MMDGRVGSLRAMPVLLASAWALIGCAAAPAREPAKAPATTSAPARPTPIAGADRDDIPAWWTQARGFYCPFANSGAGASLMKYKTGGSPADDLASFRDLPKVLADARRLGTDVIYLVDYWQPGYEYKAEYVPWEKLGGRAALRDGIKAVHEQGGRVILYLEPFIISRRTDFAKTIGHEWAMTDEQGRFYSYYDTGDRFYLMWPGEGSGWADHVVRLAGEMARDYGADGVHLDSYGVHMVLRDFNPAHPDGREEGAFNRAALDVIRRVRAEMRKYRPDAVVILEGAEHTSFLDACDGAQIESLAVLKKKPWWSARRYPIFTSSFELLEMKAILDEGYGLALSPWWFRDKPRGRDEKALTALTQKRNFDDQIAALSFYNNLLVANGVDALPLGSAERMRAAMIDALNAHGWKGEFEVPAFAADARRVLALYESNKDRMRRSPADQVRDWMRAAQRASE